MSRSSVSVAYGFGRSAHRRNDRDRREAGFARVAHAAIGNRALLARRNRRSAELQHGDRARGRRSVTRVARYILWRAAARESARRWSPHPCAADRRRTTTQSAAAVVFGAQPRDVHVVGSLDLARRHDAVAVKDDARRGLERRSPAPATLVGRCVSRKTASLCAVRTGTRTAVALTSSSGRSSILRVSSRTLRSSPLHPDASNAPTCGTTLRASRRGKDRRLRLGLAARDRAFVGEKLVEPGATRAARGLIGRDANAIAIPQRRESGATPCRARSPCSSRPGKSRCSARSASALTSGTISGTPSPHAKGRAVVDDDRTRARRAPAHIFRSRLRRRQRRRRRIRAAHRLDAARTSSGSPRNATAAGARARRKRPQLPDRNVALFEHAQDRFADGAGRARRRPRRFT